MATKSTPTAPSFDMDFTKMFGDFQKMMGDMKVPSVDVDAMMAIQKKNLDAVTAANKLAVEGMQAVAKRQQEILTQVVEESRTTLTDMMAQGAPEEKVTKQIEKAVANMKEISEMMAKSNTEAADVITTRMSAVMDEFKASMPK